MIKIIKCSVILIVMTSLLMLPALSAASADTKVKESRPVDATQKRQAITELAKLIRARYAIAESAEKAAQLLEKNFADGAYDKVNDALTFAGTITTDIQGITRDKHFRVGPEPLPEPKPETAAPAKPVDQEVQRAAWLAGIKRGNYGFLNIGILPGNVGYLDFRRFQPPDLAGDTLAGAMAFLANADAIIIDLRNCHGGSAYMTGYFAGYFFSRATHLFDMEFRGDNVTDHFWTIAYLPGKRLPDVPLYILTSAYTFSGAEGFAYRFKVLKRATIVGETTGGGANAGGVLDVAPFFRVYMPMGRPVDRDTGTNWEGTGVEPDIKTTAREALVTAHLEALKKLKTKVAPKDDQARLDWAIERVTAGRNPVNLSNEELRRFTGNYGTGRVFVEGDQLRYQPGNREPFLLTPLSPTVFTVDAQEAARLEFIPGPDGRGEKLIYIDDAGYRQEFTHAK
ncbi:MAG: S41 family peptidase [Candidatus Aminicenantes bacterium]|nr:S41 family peptidase [Candidatus Aminicenantes bacterium]